MPTTPVMAPSTPPAINGVFSPPLTPAQHPEHSSKNADSSDDDSYVGHLRAESTFLGQTQVEPPLATSRIPEPIPLTNGHIEDPHPPTPGVIPHRGSHPIKNIGPHEQGGGVPRNRSAAHIRSYTDDDGPDAQAYPRLSRPVELIRSSYDCVVIGSGYGGSIAASRMARAGKSVCLLERGREKWPGEYPASTLSALKEVHYSGKFAPYFFEGKLVDGGDPSGMFHLMFGRGQNAIVGNGLGGTSLINANVFMEADDETLKMKVWPPEIREHVDEINKYYKKVEAVLEPTEYPREWPELPKLSMLKKQAEKIGQGHNFKKVKQTTRFVNGPNSCGVEMSPSALTGQDATGINDGSKTTTLVTYLADAWNWGAEMFCECEVRHIEQAKGRDGYLIYFAWHGRNRGHFKANLHGDLMWVHAKDVVFLGAGAIGTTEILLRSKALGLGMSDQVGQNMSGNGDILAFGYNLDEQVHAIGKEYPSQSQPPIGPTINGYIDCRTNTANPLDGFVIEEGTVPHALAYFLQTMLDLMPGTKPNENETLVEKTQAAFARYGSRFLGPYYKNGAIERTQVYLIMSHDSNQAVLTLQDDIPVLEFLGVGRSDHVKKLHKLLAKATEAVGGTFVNNPFFGLLGDQEVTVHPIGGAHMARDGTGLTGVVNHAGQVFKGCGAETYGNLIVTDGAVIPAALGANPFATIAALAERSVEKYAEAHDLSISTEKNGILDLFGEPKHTPSSLHNCCGRSLLTEEEEHARAAKKLAAIAAKVVAAEAEVSTLEDEVASITGATEVMSHARKLRAPGFGFTEVMSGFVHHDERMVEDRRATYELAYRTAKSRCESARFFLSVQAYDTKTLVEESHHRALLTGTFVCPTIPGSPFMVHRGEFNLFIMDHKAPGTKNLVYDFDMTGVDGSRLHFHGYKVVDSSVALAPAALWRSTTTLYVTISEHAPGMCRDLDDDDAWRRAKVIAKGMMHIHPGDFLSEVMTMSPTGSGILQRVGSAVNFLTYFTRKSLSLFLAPLTPLQYPKQTYKGYINETPPDETIAIEARDGVMTRMLIWEPTALPKGDTEKGGGVRDLFMVPGAAVDHQIFALPTIPFHAVNYFCRAGYRVHVAVHRIGMVAAAMTHDYTTYEARLDLRACLEYIRVQRGEKPVYTIAHCMGSVALSCGMLDGTIPGSWVLGLSCSQVYMNPIWQPLNMIKAAAGPIPLDKLYGAICGDWFSCSSSPDDSLPQRLINQILRFYPDYRKEICNSATCHRTSLVFGRCWSHINLNEATHRQLHRFMGGVNMTLLALLMRMGTRGYVTTSAAQGHENLVTDENVARLKGIPIFLFVGRENAVLSPESTERTYEILCDKFAGPDGPTDKYKRRIVPGYGHLDCWMGRNAWKDVYPMVREEVDRVTRGEKYRFEEPDDKFKHMVDSGQLLY